MLVFAGAGSDRDHIGMGRVEVQKIPVVVSRCEEDDAAFTVAALAGRSGNSLLLQRAKTEIRVSSPPATADDVGPVLDGVADRWSAEELRAIVVNSKAVFGEETVMPGFYSLEVGKFVSEDLVGKTILSAQEVEDVVAYLGTLKE